MFKYPLSPYGSWGYFSNCLCGRMNFSWVVPVNTKEKKVFQMSSVCERKNQEYHNPIRNLGFHVYHNQISQGCLPYRKTL